MPNDPVDAATTMQAAIGALSKGDAAQARELLNRVIAAERADVSVWLAMAHACALLSDDAARGAAIDRALGLKPTDLSALLAKGDYLSDAGDKSGASVFYSAALQYMPRLKSLPPHLQDGLRRAQASNERLVHDLEDFVRAKLDRDIGAAAPPPRFKKAVDILFGKRRPYVQEPRYLYYPELPQIEFYERADFPWLDAMEAATGEIREELRGVVGGDFKPYVTRSAGRPRTSQADMADNPSWSAFFLFKDGVEKPGAKRCPRTVAALAHAPLSQVPNRTPSVLFSKLAAGAHIPPHTGMLNTRLICHLPLIVPAGCEFRVGNEVRPWVEGAAWVFDDTIEHEAWNRSGEDRYILLFDIWRPELGEDERSCVAALCEAIDAYRGAASWDA